MCAFWRVDGCFVCDACLSCVKIYERCVCAFGALPGVLCVPNGDACLSSCVKVGDACSSFDGRLACVTDGDKDEGGVRPERYRVRMRIYDQ